MLRVYGLGKIACLARAGMTATNPALLGPGRYHAHPATHKTGYREIRQTCARRYTRVSQTKLLASELADIFVLLRNLGPPA